MKVLALFLLSGVSASLSTAWGQSTITPTARFAYSANGGWLDLRPSTADGVRVADTVLAGYAYAANFDWVLFGDGTPDNGHTYSNTSASDSGVNVAPDGKLNGYAYAANVGWITFEQVHGFPAIDLRTGAFSGNAWSANLGWIALETSFSSLSTLSISRPDTDGDGMADAWERLHFGNLTTAGLVTDRDGDGATDLAEYLAGTLPLDAGSRLRMVSHTYNSTFTQATLTFTSVATRNYRLEYDEDLLAPWTNSSLGTFPPTAAITTRTLTGLPVVPRRFFRAVAVALPTAP